MSIVEIFDETNSKLKEINEVKKFLKFVLEYENIQDIEFYVIFVSKEKIRELNKHYRKKDKVTDVISFAFEDYKEVIYDKIRVLGDIYICLDQAIKQSEEYKHSLKREILFLSLHGFLHLLKYDHINIEDEQIMINKQKEIMDNYDKKRNKINEK